MMNKERPKIIAEISCNHEGKLEQLESIIACAKGYGADLVKIQTYTAPEMCIDESYNIPLYEGTPWDGKNLNKLYIDGQTPDWLVERAFRYAKKVDIPLFSSVFSIDGLEFLEKLGCPMYKIASFENNHYELINKVSQTKKPMIVSTGTIECVSELFAIKKAVIPGTKLTFMHCISAYPTNNNEANVHKIKDIKETMGNDVGFSDHTIGAEAAMAATVLGAKYIEKHLKSGYGGTSLDKDFSLDPLEFSKYVCSIKTIHRSLYATYNPQGPYMQFKRSLYAIKEIDVGEVITSEHIGAFRPNQGLDPIYRDSIIGKKSSNHIPRGMPILKKHMEGLY